MHAFWSVIQDLFQFILGRESVAVELAVPTATPLVTPIVTPRQLLAPSPVSSGNLQQPIFVTKQAPNAPAQIPALLERGPDALPEPRVMYVHDSDGAVCLAEPRESFDAGGEVFRYGSALTVLSYQGRFARVWRGNTEGWVRKDSLIPDKRAVWPLLIIGERYTYDTEATKKIRTLIHDMFWGGRFLLALQAGEYIMYRVFADNRDLAWRQERPRLPGMWQRLLKGVSGIHMSVTPKTDSIMEWIDEAGEGHLAYVDSVAPDNTLMVAAVGVTEPGVFTESVMTEAMWREFRPVFIEVV